MTGSLSYVVCDTVYSVSRTSQSVVCNREVNMVTLAPSMPTIVEIARRLGVPTHRVEYVIRARSIQPCGWAGNARVFDEEAVETIADELERTETLKSRNREQCGATRPD